MKTFRLNLFCTLITGLFMGSFVYAQQVHTKADASSNHPITGPVEFQKTGSINPNTVSKLMSDPVSLASFANTSQGLQFMENRGQVMDQHGKSRADILFLGKSEGIKVAITGSGISYQFEKTKSEEPERGAKMEDVASHFPQISNSETYRMDMKLIGANPNPSIVKESPQSYFENYYNIPSSPNGITGVKSYDRITLQNVYPGIDWVIYSKGETMEYDFVVHPGANPALIKMKY